MACLRPAVANDGVPAARRDERGAGRLKNTLARAWLILPPRSRRALKGTRPVAYVRRWYLRPSDVSAATRRQRSRSRAGEGAGHAQALEAQACEHEGGRRRVLVCLANIEWGARRQRPQELLAALADLGWEVYYVLPAAAFTLPRGQVAITSVESSVHEVRYGGVSDDFYGHPKLGQARDDALAGLAALAEQAGFRHAVTMVQFPTWAYVALGARTRWSWPVVYDCMDDWSDFPLVGADQRMAERVLLEQADEITVTSPTLRDLVVAHGCGPDVVVVPNGYSPAKVAAAASAAPGPRPAKVAGFMGALAEWVDYDLLAGVVEQMPDWQFVLVGDVHDRRARRLRRYSNVRMTGLLPHEEALRAASAFTVGLIPFEDSVTTATVDPVKLYEYVALGLPVVARDLRQMREFAAHASLASTSAEFVDAIRAAAGSSPSEQTADWIAGQSWDGRADVVDRLLRRHLRSVSVVLVSYGNPELTEACVRSVLHHTETVDLQVIVVDNASDAGTIEALRPLAGLDGVEVLMQPENLGFAAGCNVGLAAARGEHVVMLNNDTQVTAGWLAPLLAAADLPGVGLVGPVSNSVGNEARRDVGPIDPATACSVGRRHMAAHEHEPPFDIGMLGFFCVVGRAAVWERVGPMDEGFGVGLFEDDDYAMRVRQLGLRLLCVPASFVFHHGQASFSQLSAAEYDHWWTSNEARFAQKWGQGSVPTGDPL